MPEDDRLLGNDLAESPLASVLVNALKLKVTGELCLHHDNGEDRIYFQGGIPTGTQVFHNFKPLGRFLLDLGWITMSQLEQSLTLMNAGQRQGEALVGIGALTHKQVGDGLRLLQVRNLVEMAKLPQGRLAFDGLKPPPPWIAGVPVNALRTLREVLAVPQSLGVCQSLMQKMGGDGAEVWVPPHLLNTIDKNFELDPDEAAALRLFEKPTTLALLFQQSTLTVPRASALVAELVVTGLLQPAQAPAPREAPWSPAPPRPAGIGIVGSASAQVSDEARARRRRLLARGIANMGGFARGRAAAPPRSNDLPDAASDDLPEAAPPPRAAPPPTAAAAPKASGPPPTEAPSGDDEKLRKLIEERAKVALGPDLFARLGLGSGATKEQVKQAFVEAAQLFHPDHLPASLSALAPTQREIFAAIKEAYDTLIDDAKRRAYVAVADAAAKTPPSDPRQEQAKIAAFQGDQALRKRDWATAADLFHQAYELYPIGDYLASEAWALFSDPARNNKKAKESIQTALDEYPSSERALFYVGMLARLDGKADEAEKLFKKVLRMNPRHMEASQEMHLLKLRKKKK